MNLKSVCLLLGLCHAGSATAIGLGDISVRSHLGQPLHATVVLLGATPATLADCFSVEAGTGSIAPPLRAQFSIERAGGKTLLHIRTPRSIDDPIVQFVLAVDCDARLQRDYVVLLDPPVVVEAAVVAAAPGRVAPVAAVPGEASAETPGPAPVPRAARRAARVDPAPHAPPIARPAAASRPPAAHPKKATAAAGTPRLILSGKQGIQPEPALPLQPDAEPSQRLRTGSGEPGVAELSDDNTALSRRIAHLEMQLAMLKKRNAELDARRAAAAARVAPPVTERPPQWPLYLLAFGLLAGVGAFGNWLGRRSRGRHPLTDLTDDLAWQQSENLPALPEAAPAPLAATPPVPRPPPEVDAPAMPESTEIKDDILDQAEVYMAHGHGELAVHLLQEHLREAPTESPVPWLLLLDLLLRAGDSAGFAAAAAECSRYFNINLVSQDTETGNGLEAYPHLFDQLTQKWNTPDIDDFFDDLIYDHRGGTRLGFEPAAYREILLLRAIAQDVMPLAA